MKSRVVFDTNVYISGIVFGGNCRRLINLARTDRINLYTSKAILLELTQKLSGKFSWDTHSVHQVIRATRDISTIVTPAQAISVITTDSKDNIILECAQEAEADYIITGDKKHILPLKKFHDIPILSPAQFLRQFDI